MDLPIKQIKWFDTNLGHELHGKVNLVVRSLVGDRAFVSQIVSQRGMTYLHLAPTSLPGPEVGRFEP